MHLPALPKHHRPLLIGAVLALACLVFASTAAAESRLFWTNNETGTIGSANRAGGEVNESLFSASPEPFGIAADSSHVYWSDEGTGEIGRAELDGGNVEPSLVPNGGEVPEGVAVDGEYVYWANLLGQSIGRAKLDGSEAELDFIQLTTSPFPESVAVEGAHIYWAASEQGGEIGRANLAGGEVEEGFITGLTTSIFSIAVNSTHIYWSEYTKIGRASLDGTDVEPAFLTGLNNIGGIALDNDHVYWTSFTGDSIGRATLAGTAVEPAFITGASQPDMVAVSKNATTTSGAASASSINPGGSVSASATVAGGEGTEGTVTFSLYGPGDETCSAAPLETFTATVAGNGSYESPAVAPTTVGTYHWVSSYSGDSINEASATGCAAGAFTVDAAGNSTAAVTKPDGSTVNPGGPEIGPLRLVKVTRNHSLGIGHVRFHVPSAGKLKVSGKGVRVRSGKASKAGGVVITLIPKGAYKERLRSHRRGFTELTVTFKPASGPTVHYKRRVRLVQR